MVVRGRLLTCIRTSAKALGGGSVRFSEMIGLIDVMGILDMGCLTSLYP